jgi:hypothetical protein
MSRRTGFVHSADCTDENFSCAAAKIFGLAHLQMQTRFAWWDADARKFSCRRTSENHHILYVSERRRVMFAR